MTRPAYVVTLALALTVTGRQDAVCQHPGLSLAAHAGYNFNDLNEPLLGGQATVQFSPAAAVNAGASSFLGVTGTLWMWHLTLRAHPLARPRGAYVGVGIYQSRATNGSVSDTETGFIGTLGGHSAGQVQLFGEVQFLKDGALSTQGLAGVSVRIW